MRRARSWFERRDGETAAEQHARQMAKVPRCACGAMGVRRCSFDPADARRGQPDEFFARTLLARCEAPVCDACAVPVGPGKQHCAKHAAEVTSCR